MNLEEAEERGCPEDLLAKLSEAGIVQIGQGSEEGQEPDEDTWNTIAEDVAVILKERERRSA